MEYKFTKPTDQEHKITVDSNLLYAVWKVGCARGGAEADFEVRTSFVGQGADIEITGNGDDYGKIKKIKDKIYNNLYNGKIPIPKDIKPGEDVWFEVKLSKQRLRGKSNAIPGMPEPVLRKIQWDKKEARRGDIVKLQVKNRKIDLQWEYEYHEDVDEIPTENELKEYGKNYNPPEYFFVVDIDGYRLGEKQESGLLKFKDWIRIELHDHVGKPVPNEKYTLILADGTEKKGTLNADGYAKVEDVPPGNYYVIFHDYM
jgi:hypothetical protein